jgi:hypothetical protein
MRKARQKNSVQFEGRGTILEAMAASLEKITMKATRVWKAAAMRKAKIKKSKNLWLFMSWF